MTLGPGGRSSRWAGSCGSRPAGRTWCRIVFRLTDEKPGLVTPPCGRPGVTVLVPAYDEEKVTAGCVAALREVDCPGLEIPVLNDCSKDATVATARAAAAVGRGQTARAETWARSGCTATAWS